MIAIGGLCFLVLLFHRELRKIAGIVSSSEHRENLEALTRYVYPPEVTNLNDGATFTIGCDVACEEVTDLDGRTYLATKPDTDRSWIKCHMCGRTSYDESAIHWRFCGYCHHHHEYERRF